MSRTATKVARFGAAAALAAGLGLAAPAPAQAAGCSGSYALNSAFNYSGGWFQVGSAPTNSSVNRYTGSVKNDSNCTMMLYTANGTYFAVAHGGISALGVYVYSISI
ncbi:hypothetical protein [Dactylosporangium sp. NPDC000521]|uniref:hypothetical protein n=1 Tax=Dactylosporangium sp. NPDC000521 TaxID=3363975 RepID=UPI003684D323